MKAVCVFGGAREGRNPAYGNAAEKLGALIAQRGCGLVYGGGSIGLMGRVANGALNAGGSVTGVLPKALAAREIMHTGLNELCIVENMHARKALMAERSDAFVALPGGYGTLEELLEVITWAQLGFIHKPVGLLNVAHFFDPLLAVFDHTVAEGFVSPEQRELILVGAEPEPLLQALAARRANTPGNEFSASLT